MAGTMYLLHGLGLELIGQTRCPRGGIRVSSVFCVG
jgi:hypothetical protein